MTKDKIIQQVRNLHKSNIIIERREGLFGKQKFSLVINEDGQSRKILQAHYKGGFWNTGCYKIVTQSLAAVTSISQEHIPSSNNQDENNNIAGINDTINNKNDMIIHNHYHNHNNHICSTDEYEDEIDEAGKIIKSSLNRLKKFKKKKKFNDHDNDYVSVGKIESSGLFFDTTIIHDDQGDSKGFVTYESTSRTGELMKLKIGLPQVFKEPIENIARLIADVSNIPNDLGHVIAGYVGNVYWSKSLKNMKLSQCNKLFRENDNRLMKFQNKMPSWNPAIAAYTLEFCGRAVLPSVHNFQLTDDNDNVVLQLGKVNETTFNMDYGYPLSPFQAFAICLSVIVRTFVWD